MKGPHRHALADGRVECAPSINPRMEGGAGLQALLIQ